MGNKVAQELIFKYKGRSTPFIELPESAQMALIHYKAIDGELWDLSPELGAYFIQDNNAGSIKTKLLSIIKSSLPWYINKYGHEQFGYALIPLEEIADGIMRCEQGRDYLSFKEYHEAYISCGDVPYHPPISLWPVIFSSNGYELLEDGWHRLHSYYRSQVPIIPVVYSFFCS